MTLSAASIEFFRRQHAASRTVQINYSYPSSPNAVRLGFARAGCWTVSIATGNNVAEADAGFVTEAEAAYYARSLNIPFGRLWAKYA